MMNTDNTLKTTVCWKTTPTRICWSALLIGAFTGVGLGFLLNLFAMAIGLSAYSSSPSGANAVAIGGVIGLLIGVIASMGVAGFVAGYLGRFYHCYCHGGVIYGFATWSLALMLSALLFIPMANYMAFYEENLSPAVASAEATHTVANTPTTTSTPTTAVSVQTKHLAWSGWILFIIFFIGAFSCCVGACYGMRCSWENNAQNPPMPNSTI
jgi:hypothetical protein